MLLREKKVRKEIVLVQQSFCHKHSVIVKNEEFERKKREKGRVEIGR